MRTASACETESATLPSERVACSKRLVIMYAVVVGFKRERCYVMMAGPV